MRIIVLLCGVLIYLAVMFVFGKHAETSSLISGRLSLVEKMGQFNIDESEDFESPFLERFLKPGMAKIVNYIGAVVPVNASAVKNLNEQLRQSGKKQTAQEYIAVHITILGMTIVAVFIFANIVSMTNLKMIYMLFIAICAVYVFSRFRLTQRITERKDKIEGDMPDILDLLSVSVLAGLGFDQALLYVTERCKGPLVDELKITQKEIALGRTRSDALKQLADRCGVEALNMFVSAVIQAETMGIPISNVLKTQADSIRNLHREKIEEKAAKLPVKILLPIVLLVFPNIFIIILGPAVPRIMQVL